MANRGPEASSDSDNGSPRGGKRSHHARDRGSLIARGQRREGLEVRFEFQKARQHQATCVQPNCHTRRTRSRCSAAPRSPAAQQPQHQSARAKAAAARVPRIVVHDPAPSAWNVTLRPRTAALKGGAARHPPARAVLPSPWEAVGGAPAAAARADSPSSASTNTDDSLERDAEAVALQAELAATQRERAAFGRRLQDVEVRMRRVRAEMDELRGRQRERQERVVAVAERRSRFP